MALDTTLIPGNALTVDRMPGHWLLARLGKRVLRPGGVELTHRLLDALDIGPTDHVVELAPGMGATTRLILQREPAGYVGVDRDPVSAERVGGLLERDGYSVTNASAAETGLDDSSADVAFGEAYLTMHPTSQKRRILAELARIVRPGGRIGIHEIAFLPDGIDPAVAHEIAADMTSSIKVNVSPLAIAEWVSLLRDAGFEVQDRFTAPLHLLEPGRLIADEGVIGAARFASNVLRQPDARDRVLEMRSSMRRHADHMQACVLTAVRTSTP